MSTDDYWARTDYRTIGGSDVAAILGVSPYRTACDVYDRVTADAPPEAGEQTPQQIRGHVLEPALLAWWRQETGLIAEPTSLPCAESWARATVDGLTPGLQGIVEIKTASRADGWAPRDDVRDWSEPAIPVHYQAQIAWYLHHSRADWCDVVVLLPSLAIRRIRYHHARAVTSALARRVSDWYEAHVVAGVRPEPTTLADLTPGTDPEPVELDEQAAELLRDYREAKAAERAASERADAARFTLGRLLGDARVGQCSAGKARWVRRPGRPLVALDRLRDGWPEVYEAVVTEGKPSESLMLYPRKEATP